MISLVVETWNLRDARDARAELELLVDALAPQVDGVEVVVTLRAPVADADRAAIAARLGQPIRWLELPASAGYYDHKTAGFAATTGEIVAFLDGDCAPTPTWLAALTRPFATGARVVAGATTYAGELAAVGNRLDFPYFDRARLRSFGAGDPGAYEVRNFFANNVAFRRDVFAAHPYPTITPMFHGQCQVLALTLAAHGIAIRYAAAARVTHAWPGSLAAWLEVRLLRGADAVSLLPYVMPITRHLGALPALAMFGARALLALRRGPRLRALGLIASVTVVDAIGAATAGRVYRALA